jgi:hypothetical protein
MNSRSAIWIKVKNKLINYWFLRYPTSETSKGWCSTGSLAAFESTSNYHQSLSLSESDVEPEVESELEWVFLGAVSLSTSSPISLSESELESELESEFDRMV